MDDDDDRALPSASDQFHAVHRARQMAYSRNEVRLLVLFIRIDQINELCIEMSSRLTSSNKKSEIILPKSA